GSMGLPEGGSAVGGGWAGLCWWWGGSIVGGREGDRLFRVQAGLVISVGGVVGDGVEGELMRVRLMLEANANIDHSSQVIAMLAELTFELRIDTGKGGILMWHRRTGMCDGQGWGAGCNGARSDLVLGSDMTAGTNRGVLGYWGRVLAGARSNNTGRGERLEQVRRVAWSCWALQKGDFGLIDEETDVGDLLYGLIDGDCGISCDEEEGNIGLGITILLSGFIPVKIL
ncbi:hypothetical protein Tco_0836312, partial [Tanacetum coccineum]